MAHDDLAASLHEALCGCGVKGAATRDEAETLKARAARQGLKERRVGIQVRLLQPTTHTPPRIINQEAEQRFKTVQFENSTQIL